MSSPDELGERGSEPEFSGLFAYHVPTTCIKFVLSIT